MKTIVDQLNEFIKESEFSRTNNKWLFDDAMKVYVRKGVHVLESGKISTTLDIAAIEVEEDKQRQGIWTLFVNKAHDINPWQATYIENVYNPFLFLSLTRNGWTIIKNNPESFYMLKNSIDNSKTYA